MIDMKKECRKCKWYASDPSTLGTYAGWCGNKKSVMSIVEEWQACDKFKVKINQPTGVN